MLQGGKAVDISESAAEESAWHRLTVKLGEGEREAPRWQDHGRHLLWGRTTH